jgi:hypothetical protein
VEDEERTLEGYIESLGGMNCANNAPAALIDRDRITDWILENME